MILTEGFDGQKFPPDQDSDKLTALIEVAYNRLEKQLTLQLQKITPFIEAADFFHQSNSLYLARQLSRICSSGPPDVVESMAQVVNFLALHPLPAHKHDSAGIARDIVLDIRQSIQEVQEKGNFTLRQTWLILDKLVYIDLHPDRVERCLNLLRNSPQEVLVSVDITVFFLQIVHAFLYFRVYPSEFEEDEL
jgi:hypothetical protein